MQDNRCSYFPNGNWLECCVWHDLVCEDSRLQKSSSMRLKADKALRTCVSAKGHPAVALIMYIGCRVYVNLKGGY